MKKGNSVSDGTEKCDGHTQTRTRTWIHTHKHTRTEREGQFAVITVPIQMIQFSN